MTLGLVVRAYGERYYVPSRGRTHDGLAVDVAPVRVSAVHDIDALAANLYETSLTAVQSMASVDWRAKPVVVAAAGAKSWRAFARSAVGWSIAFPQGGGAVLRRIQLVTSAGRAPTAHQLRAAAGWDAWVAREFATEIERDLWTSGP